MKSAYLAFAVNWNWHPEAVDDLLMEVFWHFMEYFADMAKQNRRGRGRSKFHPDDNNPDAWVRDPRYRKGR